MHRSTRGDFKKWPLRTHAISVYAERARKHRRIITRCAVLPPPPFGSAALGVDFSRMAQIWTY